MGTNIGLVDAIASKKAKTYSNEATVANINLSTQKITEMNAKMTDYDTNVKQDYLTNVKGDYLANVKGHYDTNIKPIELEVKTARGSFADLKSRLEDSDLRVFQTEEALEASLFEARMETGDSISGATVGTYSEVSFKGNTVAGKSVGESGTVKITMLGKNLYDGTKLDGDLEQIPYRLVAVTEGTNVKDGTDIQGLSLTGVLEKKTHAPGPAMTEVFNVWVNETGGLIAKSKDYTYYEFSNPSIQIDSTDEEELVADMIVEMENKTPVEILQLTLYVPGDISGYIRVKGDKPYTFSVDGYRKEVFCAQYDKDKNLLGFATLGSTVNTKAEAYYIRVSGVSTPKFQVEAGYDATAFMDYNKQEKEFAVPKPLRRSAQGFDEYDYSGTITYRLDDNGNLLPSAQTVVSTPFDFLVDASGVINFYIESVVDPSEVLIKYSGSLLGSLIQLNDSMRNAQSEISKGSTIMNATKELALSNFLGLLQANMNLVTTDNNIRKLAQRFLSYLDNEEATVVAGTGTQGQVILRPLGKDVANGQAVLNNDGNLTVNGDVISNRINLTENIDDLNNDVVDLDARVTYIEEHGVIGGGGSGIENKTFTIADTDWVENKIDHQFEYTLVHDMDSLNVLYSAISTDSNGYVFIGASIIDSNTIRLELTRPENIRVILNANSSIGGN